jgi:hypothetical protein
MASKSNKKKPKATPKVVKAIPTKAGRKVSSARLSVPAGTSEDGLFDRVAQILEQARAQVARTVNTAMVC